MKIELRKVSAITPYESNPRVNDQSVDLVAKSIQEFGFRQPIVVDKDGVIVAGHTRWKAAQKAGLDLVPVHVAADLTTEQAKAYRLADNKLGELAEWDKELLPVEVKDLQAAEYDLSLLGFSEDELASLLSPPGSAGLTDSDSAPEVPEAAVSKPGAAYALGRHRLLVGDATNAEHVARLMGETRADLLLTDPPYNVAYTGKTKDALTIENDAMEDPEFRGFLLAAFKNADAVMRPGATFYIWHADSEGFNFRAACKDAGWRVRQCLIWAKNTMVLGRQDYQWRHEPCLYGWKDGSGHKWYSDRKQTTVLEFNKPSRSSDHPTMKPTALFEYQISNSTKPGDTVLDLFSGSGTTIIASERLGRTAYGLELDPRYADVIRRRWAEFVHGDGCDWEALTPVVE